MVGRPKTLNREHALAIALEGYWREGVYGMSVNEVCRRAKISKPGLYREFGGEDGLLTAVLQLYRETVMETLAEHLRQDSSFKKVFHWYVNALLHQNGHPPGCLLCEMRLIQSEDLGQTTREKVQECADDIYGFYRDWLEGAQKKGEISAEVDLDTAARLLDSQMMTASLKAYRGGNVEKIKEELQMALWRLTPDLEL